MLIEARGCFERTRGLHRPGTLGHSDLERRNEEKHISVWLLRAPGRFGQVGMCIEVRGTLGQRRQSPQRSPNLADTRAGSIDRRRQHAFDGRGGSNILARLDDRAGYHRHPVQQSVAVAPLCGLFATSRHSRALGVARAHSTVRLTRAAAVERRNGIGVNRGPFKRRSRLSAGR